MNKNIVRIILAVAFTAFVSSVGAIEISVAHDLKTKYVAPAGGNYYDGPIVQTDVYVAWKNGVYIDFFNTTGLEHGNPSPYGNENDYTLGVVKEFGGLSFDAKVSYWDCSHLFSTYPADVVVGTLSVTKKISGSTSVTVSYDHYKSTAESFFDSGMLATFEVCHSRKIVAADLNVTGAIMREDGAFGATPAWVASLEAVVSWSIGDSVTIKPLDVKVVKPLSAVYDGRKTEWIFGAGVSYTF